MVAQVSTFFGRWFDVYEDRKKGQARRGKPENVSLLSKDDDTGGIM